MVSLIIVDQALYYKVMQLKWLVPEYRFKLIPRLGGLHISLYMNIALRRFLNNHGNFATERIVHSTIGSTVHSMPLNSLERCICTTTMTNIRPDRDSNLVPPGYKPQSIRMSHRGRRRYL